MIIFTTGPADRSALFCDLQSVFAQVINNTVSKEETKQKLRSLLRGSLFGQKICAYAAGARHFFSYVGFKAHCCPPAGFIKKRNLTYLNKLARFLKGYKIFQ
jgi:hypothetical protein